jgi:hypothetical protein
MTSASDDRRTAEELAALAQANLDGIHGCIDSPHDAPQPCLSCRWCHRASTPAAAALNPTAATRSQPSMIETTDRVAPVRVIGLSEFVREAPREAREFCLPGPCPLPPRLEQETQPDKDPARASGHTPLTPGYGR